MSDADVTLNVLFGLRPGAVVDTQLAAIERSKVFSALQTACGECHPALGARRRRKS
jgi:hypothetical protein